jgi:alpha-glucosidase
MDSGPDARSWIPESPAWWQRGVIYQIYPRSFFDASGDGIGDLTGIRHKVSYLAWLGIDAVWLSPIYSTPDVDLGYDIADYRSIDPQFGTLEDFDELMAALHDKNIKIILDLVPNHTSDQHPWFVESRSEPRGPKRDWYVWRDSRPDGAPPNNWESYFGGPAWHYLDPPGQWYLHSFDRGQPDLNWDNPEVRRAMQEVMRFWLDRGVDGFRVDVLWLLGKDPELRDNPMDPDWGDLDPPWLRLRRKNSEDGPMAHAYARLLRSVVNEYRDRVMIGEVVLPPARAVAYHGENLDEAHMPHNFALAELGTWTADEIRKVVEEYESLMPPKAWPNWLLGDHDFSRIASRIGPERTQLALMLLLTLRGTPTWYYGDELGLPNATFDDGVRLVDAQASTAPERDRLAARTPMQWSPAPFGGFSEVPPWLPLASDDPQLTIESQREMPGSTLNFVRALIQLRKRMPALSIGAYRSLPAPPGVFSFERWHPDGVVQVHLNFEKEAREVQIPSPCELLLSTIGAGTRGVLDPPRFTLQAHEGVIIKVAEV